MAEVQEALVEVRSSTILSGHDKSKVTSRQGYFLLPRSVNSPNPSSANVAVPTAEAALKVDFCKSWSGRPHLWQRWVEKLRPTHEAVWKQIGILDGIVGSARRCNRNDTLLLEVAKFWSPRTNTFIFPWGEATVTLEDLAVLGGLPVLGSSVRVEALPEIEADAKELERVRWILNDSKSKKPNFSAWVKHFLDSVPTDVSNKQRLEHGAFLAMWLSMSVLKEEPFNVVNPNGFYIAARMARGQGVALAPAALAGLYKGLSSLKLHICSRDEEQFVVDTPLNVLQLWILERFPALRSKVEESSQEGLDSVTVRGELESPMEFEWMPYSRPNVALRGCWISADDIIRSRELQSFARYIRACDLVGMWYTEKYNPHRVARQFGFDQDVPGTVARRCSDWKESWRRYDLKPECITFFIPDSEPGVTINYKKWWKDFSCNKGISKNTMATAIGEGSSTSTGPGIKRKRQDRQDTQAE